MSTMNVSLPEELKAFVDERVVSSGYSTHSEYIRELIRQDQREEAQKRLAHLIAEGLNSKPTVSVDDAYWKKKRAAVRKTTRV